MASTLTQMRARLTDDFLDALVSSTQIDLAINRAIVYYQHKNFWFNQTSDTFSTVAAQQSYTTGDGLASDIIAIDYAKILINTSNCTLEPFTFPQLQEMTTSTSDRGQPTAYAWGLNKMWVYPIPDAVYTVTVYYRKSYTALSADSDTNDWMTYAEDLIEARATAWLHNRITKDAEGAQMAKAEEYDALRALVKKDRQINPAVTLASTSF